MKKLLLAFGLIISSLHAYSQNGYSSVFLRVTDSATFVNSANTTAKHAANYADIWYSVSSGLFWKWSTVTNTYTMISEGGNFWKNSGTTTLTGNVLIDGGTNDIFIDTDGDWRFGNSNSAIYTDIGANQMLWYSNAFSFLISGTLIDIQSPGNGAGVVVSANDVAIGATDDVNISAGPTGSAHDVNISSAAGHIHLQTGAAGILLDPAGPITINTDPGTAGDVLQSNGAGAAPTWVAPSGGVGGLNTFVPNIQTGNYTALIADTIRVVLMRSASAQNFTIPPDVFPIGSYIQVVQDSIGTTTIVAGAGVAFENPSGSLTLTENTFAVLYQKYSNGWIISKGGAGGTIDGTGTTNELPYWVDSNTLGSLAVATYPSLTELSYVKGATSAIQTQFTGKADLVNTSSALTDGAAITITGIKHTLTSTQATVTWTLSQTPDFQTTDIILNATSTTWTFPAGALCVVEGVASGTNTAALAGVSGDHYVMSIYKDGTNYRVAIKNFGQ